MNVQKFWAKKAEQNGIFMWLPVTQHLKDTAFVMGQLWEHWLSSGQRDLMIRSLRNEDEDIAKSLAVFLGAIHDLGKISPSFQTKKGFNNSSDLDQQLIEALENEGFTDLKYFNPKFSTKTPHALVGQVLLLKFGVNEGVASMVGAHHGRPTENEALIKKQASYQEEYYQCENKDSLVHQLWRRSQADVFNWALALAEFKSAKDIPEVNQAGLVLYSGLLIMADWIASNESYFPLVPLEANYSLDQVERMKTGWLKWYQTAGIEFELLENASQVYNQRFGKQGTPFIPRDFQQRFFDLVNQVENPGIFILEAPMGKGKTEAALIGAEQLAYRLGRNGIFFGLPTQATSDGVFPRIHRWLSRVGNQYLDESSKISLQLVHGKSQLNEAFSKLAKNINIDGDKDDAVTVNQWFRGRKTSNLDDFVVGTVDQFLLNALKQKHLALRHLGFSKKVVIIDEAHSYDSFMNQYMQQALRWMGAYQVPVIILSATLAASTRETLVKAYIEGTGVRPRHIELPQEGLLQEAYPLITYSDGTHLKQYCHFELEPGYRIPIHSLNESELIDHLDQWAQNQGVIGIIVNTVKKAQNLGRLCSERYGVKLVEVLHSAFIATDRKKKERQLLDSIGKNAQRPDFKIVIGTQVMEQSLDIDFDVMVSELAPMDLMIQRMGRLHRHQIDRPLIHKEPRFYVIGLSDTYEFDSGSRAVYGDYLLMKTQDFLPKNIHIPDDISPLVQHVYQEEPKLIDSDVYREARIEFEKKMKEKERKAQNYMLDRPLTHSSRNSITLTGWLSEMNPNQTEAYGYAQVRDSDESLEVILLQKVNDGYGLLGSNQNLADCVNDLTISRRIAQETIVLPRSMSASYNIDASIKTLEAYRIEFLPEWSHNPWLKGQLAIILDEDGRFKLNHFQLVYSIKYGLEWEYENKG